MNPRHDLEVVAIALLIAISTAWWNVGRAEALEKGEGGMVHTISGRGANVYLIEGEAGWALVDTGMKGNVRGLQIAFSNLGIDPQNIRLIVITHAHPDHYGELAALKRLTGAKVLAHRYEASFIESGRSSPIVAQSVKGRLINAISPKWKMESSPVEIVLDDELDLTEFGVHGKVFCTPGHTAGSVSIVLEDGSVLVGDQFRGKAGRLTLGMFYENSVTLLASLKRIAGFEPKVLYMSHGAATDQTDLEAFISALKQ